MELDSLTRGAARLGVALGLTLTASGCQSCAGISDLEIGAAGGGGATVDAGTGSVTSQGGGTPTSGVGGASTSSAGGGGAASSVSSSSTSTTSSAGGGGPACDGGNCEVGEFCEAVRMMDGTIEETCRTCGSIPAAPPEVPCPSYCANDCAGDVCEAECPAGRCAPELRLDAKIMPMRKDCVGSECALATITCRGGGETEGPGPFDCHVVCDADAGCNGLHLDCTGHSGRCIFQCEGSGCFGVRVTCGANACVVCGEGHQQVTPVLPGATCELRRGDLCAELLAPELLPP